MVTRPAQTAIAACRATVIPGWSRYANRTHGEEERPVRSRRYDTDVLAVGRTGSGGSGRRRPGQREVPKIEAERGLVVEDSQGRFCGAVVGYEKGAVLLEDRHGKRRVFPLTPAAFLLDGKPVTLIPPAPAGGPGGSGGSGGSGLRPARTASGSVAAPVRERA